MRGVARGLSAEGGVVRHAVLAQPAAARAQSGSFGTQVRAPRLEIKKDAKGMVTVPGARAASVPHAGPLHARCAAGPAQVTSVNACKGGLAWP